VEFTIEEMGLLSGIDPNIGDIRSRYQKRGLAFGGAQQVTVPAATLTAILRQHLPAGVAEIDLMSIDVEGHEADVLRGLDFQRYRPRIIVAEANSEDAEAALLAVVGEHGYRPARQIDVNILYVHRQEDIDRLGVLEVNGQMEMQFHPYGEAFTTNRIWKPSENKPRQPKNSAGQ
jgi:hypothetical protein